MDGKNWWRSWQLDGHHVIPSQDQTYQVQDRCAALDGDLVGGFDLVVELFLGLSFVLNRCHRSDDVKCLCHR